MMKLLEPERIYSTGQLLEALQSGLAGLKEQLQVCSTRQQRCALSLNRSTKAACFTSITQPSTCVILSMLLCLQVLSILDGSASSWPGLSSALSDLDSLVVLTVKHAAQLDQAKAKLEADKSQLSASLSGAG